MTKARGAGVLLSQSSFQLPGNSRRRPFNFSPAPCPRPRRPLSRRFAISVQPCFAVATGPELSPYPHGTMLNDKFSNISLKPQPLCFFRGILFLPPTSSFCIRRGASTVVLHAVYWLSGSLRALVNGGCCFPVETVDFLVHQAQLLGRCVLEGSS